MKKIYCKTEIYMVTFYSYDVKVNLFVSDSNQWIINRFLLRDPSRVVLDNSVLSSI